MKATWEQVIGRKLGRNELMVWRAPEIAVHNIFSYILSRVSFMLLALMSQNKLSPTTAYKM